MKNNGNNKLDFFNKRVLVVGNGVSGTGAKNALNKLGAIVYSYNDGEKFVDIDYDYIILSPGIEKEHFLYSFAKNRGIPIFGEYALGVLINEKPLIAITGTNGKTTVTDMTGKVMSSEKKVTVCGNIGVSFAESAVMDNYEVAVTEVSSFQLEQTPYVKPNVAVITNITPDHLIRHKSMDEYAKLKYSLSTRQTTSDFLILPYDDYLYGIDEFSTKADTFYVSNNRKVKGAYVKDGYVWFCNEKLFSMFSFRYKERHNITDMLFAVSIGKLMGIGKNNIEHVISEYVPENHRLKFVGKMDGVKFYNDSKSTNVGSLISALSSMEGSVCLIMCGSNKGLCYDTIFDFVENVKWIFVSGEIKDSVFESASRRNFNEISVPKSLENAVVSAFLMKPDNVLFSPGSASFDEYSSYKERGENFERIVREIFNEK